MKTVFIIYVLLCTVGGEMFDGKNDEDRRIFVAPDVINGTVAFPAEVEAKENTITPLAEWSYEESEFGLKLSILGGEAAQQLQSFRESSEVGSILVDVCRGCMVSLNIACIQQFCKLYSIQPHHFVTGVSLHGDILCSLCKHKDDEQCIQEFCLNPDRDKNAIENGIECMQGFCRWQKESVVSTGYNNYLNAWWMPQSVYVWVDKVAQEIAVAYQDFMSVTSNVMGVIG